MSDYAERLEVAPTQPDTGDSELTDAQHDRADLLSAARDVAALERLVARHSQRVFRYIHSRINNLQTCEDLTQDVFMRLCRDGYDGTASVKTWIFSIARHRVVDFFRSESRRPSTCQIPEQLEFPEHHPSDPGRNLSLRDEDQRIGRWLTQLPEEQAEAVRLRIIAGLSFAQTADVLGCPVPTCKSRVRYGLAKLKTLIQEEIEP
jgi:RNA polymerase sigma-70 factor (ECF subfamily)